MGVASRQQRSRFRRQNAGLAEKLDDLGNRIRLDTHRRFSEGCRQGTRGRPDREHRCGVHGAEVGAGNRTGRRRIAIETKFPGREKKRARLCRRNVTHALPARFPICRDVEHVLIVIVEQVVESAPLGRRTRQVDAPEHHLMKEGGLRTLERHEQLRDGVPRRLPFGFQDVAAYFRDAPAIERISPGQFTFQCDVLCDDRLIEHPGVTGESRDDQVGVEPGQFLDRDFEAGLHQHFEPQAEAIGVELFVGARRTPPHVGIEDARELRRCRQRHELRGVFEAAMLDDTVEDLGRQLRDDVREARSVQQTSEERLRL